VCSGVRHSLEYAASSPLRCSGYPEALYEVIPFRSQHFDSTFRNGFRRGAAAN
jgi:hypothetical protein